jgi:AraC-like DNA-binding protein
MLLDYEIKPSLVEKILVITHKGKKSDYTQRLHKHVSGLHEMIFVDYGKIILSVSGVSSEIKPGECIFIPGGSSHSFTGEKGAPFNFLNIMFYGKVPQSIFGKNLHVNRKCLELMEKLKQETYHEMLYFREVVAASLTELIVLFLRQINVSIPARLPKSANCQRYQSEYVNRALTVIANEYSTPLNLKQLSRAAGIGESRLRQLLMIETGENFSAILHKQRIAAAKHLLADGSISILNISNSVGYSDTSFFFRIFKRITGMTPKEYSLSLGDPTVRE